MSVESFEDDGLLPHRQTVIEREVGHLAVGLFFIAGDQRLAREETRLCGDRVASFRLRVRRVTRRPPISDEPAQIRQWIAEGSHLPIKDGDELGRWLGGEHDIVQLVIAMDHTGAALWW